MAGEMLNLLHTSGGPGSAAIVAEAIAWPTSIFLLSLAMWLPPGRSSPLASQKPASFALPVVNIGLRQHGRERAPNILDAAPNAADILAKIAIAHSPSFRDELRSLENPYGDGHAAARIVSSRSSSHGTSLPTSCPITGRSCWSSP